jgi:RHS repeat-associated protein
MTLDHPDELGSLSTAIDYATSHFAERLFYPFGEFWQGSDFYSLNPHQTFAQLPDYDNDASTDLYNTLNRHYTPMGRWLSPDPGGVNAVHLDDPQTWNMYAYVRNNPTTLVDPLGLQQVVVECAQNMKTCVGAQGKPQPPTDKPTESAAQNQAKTTPAPTNPDGSPAKPPNPPPPGKDGKPNEWVRVPGTENRPDKWVPRDPVPSPKGGQPGASWDERGGHWDVDDGNRNRTRWLPDGTQVDHYNNPIPMSSPGSGVVNFVREHPVAVGIGVVVVGGTAILLTGGAAAPALALAF